MVASLWAIVTIVLPFVSSDMAACIKCSFSGSTLAVASSSMMIGASLSIALAIEIRCFSPPDRLPPPSPITVSYLSGNAMMKSWQHAFFAAAIISSSVASDFPKQMLFLIVSLNRYTFWNTMDIFDSRLSQVNSFTS